MARDYLLLFDEISGDFNYDLTIVIKIQMTAAAQSTPNDDPPPMECLLRPGANTVGLRLPPRSLLLREVLVSEVRP